MAILKFMAAKIKSLLRTNHSFLFWLTIPIFIIWLSFGYIVGFITDRPSWKTAETKTTLNAVIPYFQTLTPAPKNGPFLVSFWFDDAWISQYLKAYPLLTSFGYKAAVAVPANAIETANYMNWAQLRVLQKNGWEITNHSSRHDCQMDKWNETQVIREYQTSRLALWRQGLTSDIFVTPCGVDSPVMRNLANKYFLAYRTVNPGFNELQKPDPYNLKIKNLDDQTTLPIVSSWITEAKANNSWLILVFHKIDDNSKEVGAEKYNITLDNLTKILQVIKTSGAQIVTPGQVIFFANTSQ